MKSAKFNRTYIRTGLATAAGQISRVSILLFLCCLMLYLIGCAGGGNAGTGAIKIAGLVVDPQARPAAAVQVTDLATNVRTTTDSQGKFDIDTFLNSILVFAQGGRQVEISLDSLPREALSVVAVFEIDLRQEQGRITQVQIVELRPEAERGTPVPTPGSSPPAIQTSPVSSSQSETTPRPSASTPKPQATATRPSAPSAAPTSAAPPTPKDPAVPDIETPLPSATSTATSPTVTPTATERVFGRGDINCDGALDFSDLQCMRAVIEGNPEQDAYCRRGARICPYAERADLTQDGVVDSRDVDELIELLSES